MITKASLLAVDDNQANRELLAEYFTQAGYHVVTTENGRRAIELIGKHNFDLVLLDILMPGMDGFETLRIIRQTHPATRLPVIMATGQGESENVVAGLAIGANDYVTKPLDLPVVRARVETHISLKNAADQILQLERERDHLRARENEIARQVQSRLLRQRKPAVETLDYAGCCFQADYVGGDYFDYLDLGEGRLGLVLADVSGKGFFAALLMASLQASLRSQSALAREDLGQLVHSVNRFFYDVTAMDQYATLFLGSYEDRSRRLRYANCGHNPPLLLRSNGAVERLSANAIVLGFLESLDCSIDEVDMSPGDLLALYSDELTEAHNEANEQFGEERLLETLRSNAHLPPSSLLQAVISAVRQFSHSKQKDDQTLIIARVR